MRRAGLLLIMGGAAWLTGALSAGAVMESSEEALPLPVALLGALAGLAVGWGGALVSSHLSRPLARVGVRTMAVCAVLLGLGLAPRSSAFTESVLANSVLVYLLVVVAVGVLFYVMPVVFMVLGVGLIGGDDMGRWGGWALLATGVAGVIAYWLPTAFVSSPWWLIVPGIGWLLLGLVVVAESRRMSVVDDGVGQQA